MRGLDRVRALGRARRAVTHRRVPSLEWERAPLAPVLHRQRGPASSAGCLRPDTEPRQAALAGRLSGRRRLSPRVAASARHIQATPRRQRRGLSGVDRALLFLERTLLTRRRYRLIVAISARVRADLIRHYAVPPEHIRVIYNGVDTQRFHPAARQERADAARRRSGGAGRRAARPVHGHRLRAQGARPPAARVAGAGEQIWLVVAGRDAEADSYRALARSLGIEERVRFLGPVSATRPLYAAADVLVLPTLYEPFSNACLEAHGLRPSGRHDPGRRRVGASA